MKEFSKITDAQMKARGVQALADRPNQTGQFGVSGLTAAQVKQHFDLLATYLAGKLNFLFEELKDPQEAAFYIALALDEYEDLGELIADIKTGGFAKKLLMVYPSAGAESVVALQNVVNDFAKKISECVVQITEAAENSRVYAVSKDGEQTSIAVANEGEVRSGSIPVYNERGELVANNLVTGIRFVVDKETNVVRLSLLAGENALYTGELSREDVLSFFDENGDGIVDFATESDLKRATISSLTWDAESASNNVYAVKAFAFDAADKQTNVDFEVRVGTKDGVFFRYPCNLQRPFGNSSRIVFRVPRIIFEDESKKNVITYFRVYEKGIENSTEREVWFEIKTTSSDSMPVEYHFNLQAKSGTITDVELVQKDYEPYVAKSGYDSLTINSADWANKTSNLNISSRAAAPYASASGNDSRAEGEAGDVGGIGNTGKGKASIVRGEANTERGLYNAVFGNKHEFLGTAQTAQSNIVGGSSNKIKENAIYDIVGGNANTVAGSSSVVGGGKSTVTGGYDLSVGYDAYVTGEGSGNIGHYNRIIHKQAQTFGRYLATGRNYQARFGVGAERDSDGDGKDKTSMLVVSNGAENGSKGVDIFAVSNAYSGDAENGYYAKANKPNDAITLGYLTEVFKAQLKAEILAEIGTGGGSADSTGRTIVLTSDYTCVELASPLVAGYKYYIEDVLFVAEYGPNGDDDVRPPSGMSFVGTDGVTYRVVWDGGCFSIEPVDGKATIGLVITIREYDYNEYECPYCGTYYESMADKETCANGPNCPNFVRYLIAPNINNEHDDYVHIEYPNEDASIEQPTHYEIYLNGFLQYTAEKTWHSYVNIPYSSIYGASESPQTGDRIYVCAVIKEGSLVIRTGAESNTIINDGGWTK